MEHVRSALLTHIQMRSRVSALQTHAVAKGRYLEAEENARIVRQKHIQMMNVENALLIFVLRTNILMSLENVKSVMITFTMMKLKINVFKKLVIQPHRSLTYKESVKHAQSIITSKTTNAFRIIAIAT
jgi:hypothetical protein